MADACEVDRLTERLRVLDSTARLGLTIPAGSPERGTAGWTWSLHVGAAGARRVVLVRDRLDQIERDAAVALAAG